MRPVFALALAAAALSSCGQPKQVYVDHAYVRLPAVKGNPAAAYFTLHGGAEDATLIDVTSPVTIKTEMHETVRDGRMMAMKEIAQVPLPAGGTIKFAPGGKHVMMFDINPGIVAGKDVPMVFSFSNGLRIQYSATSIGAGDAPPKS